MPSASATTVSGSTLAAAASARQRCCRSSGFAWVFGLAAAVLLYWRGTKLAESLRKGLFRGGGIQPEHNAAFPDHGPIQYFPFQTGGRYDGNPSPA